MVLDNIRIVLVRPQSSQNIGSVCRAMANCDIGHLRIVGNRADYDETQVRMLAVHAGGVFDGAEFFGDIEGATADCSISFGTTRRRGALRGRLYLPGEATSLIGKVSDGGKVAVVFGNEQTGLTDAELSKCTQGLTIPTSKSFGSLNLSHAVQIVCYCLFQENYEHKQSYVTISLKRLDEVVGCVVQCLQDVGFFKKTGSEAMERFWRNILSRASLSEGEASYIMKTFSKVAGIFGKQKEQYNKIENN